MNTAIQVNPLSISVRTVKAVYAEAKTSSTSDFWKNAEFNRFGIVAFLLVIVTCLGGFAAAVAVKESTLQLAVVTSSAMLVEALILAVTPMRAIIISSVISVVISLFVIVF
jgi:hypothetical protein